MSVSVNSSRRDVVSANDANDANDQKCLPKTTEVFRRFRDAIIDATSSSRCPAVAQEFDYFANITSMHGVLRVHRNRTCSAPWMVWMTALFGCIGMLVLQFYLVLHQYIQGDTPIQVNFIIGTGLRFPRITVCSYNPIKQSYINETMRKSSDFNEHILRYMMLLNMDTQVIHWLNESDLLNDSKEFDKYKKKHPGFKIKDFYRNARFKCEEEFKICTFAGIPFNCCKYVKEVETTMGTCYSLNLAESDAQWMNEQNEDGIDAGLQIILDAHVEEQYNGSYAYSIPVFANSFEDGFRFFIDSPFTKAHANSQGISVSPGDRVYSALFARKVARLDPVQSGSNCTNTWPVGINSSLPYSSRNCLSKCKADFYDKECQCSPAKYNIDNEYKDCDLSHLHKCLRKQSMRDGKKGEFYWPACDKCKIECERWEYSVSNSYGHGLNSGALKWLQSKNSSWTKEHITKNFLSINVFFHDMMHMEYTQLSPMHWSELLSNIGGNTGLFLGMSVLTMLEVVMLCCKLVTLSFFTGRVEKNIRKYAQSQAQRQAGTTMWYQQGGDNNVVAANQNPPVVAVDQNPVVPSNQIPVVPANHVPVVPSNQTPGAAGDQIDDVAPTQVSPPREAGAGSNDNSLIPAHAVCICRSGARSPANALEAFPVRTSRKRHIAQQGNGDGW